MLMLFNFILIPNVASIQYYTLSSCEAQDNIATSLPNECLIDKKISDGSVPNTSAGFDNNFGPLLAANIRGQGIRVVLVDDGLDISHPDIEPNVDLYFVWNLSGETSIFGR
ncbi:hypothetical protein Ciccas_007855 [Cichlidogyrus casuarinus]|uniref:Peptidase S8/S53 domain-containing protein n=1 Tax=Cichlidogyrus casuarinus TaxID=1844966 RepID=A0ABD2Q1M7_9PLAT